MKIHIRAIGKISATSPEKILIKEYIKRIGWPVNVKEYEEKSKLSVVSLKDAESKLLLLDVSDHYIIALDENGKEFTSVEFSGLFTKLQNDHIRNISFLIGGANGHGELVLARANMKLSLSKMTLPHTFARVILLEQIYRAQTILSNHPYHK